eukprot:6194922-Pleurochrysis_carterae.AAC.4
MKNRTRRSTTQRMLSKEGTRRRRRRSPRNSYQAGVGRSNLAGGCACPPPVVLVAQRRGGARSATTSRFWYSVTTGGDVGGGSDGVVVRRRLDDGQPWGLRCVVRRSVRDRKLIALFSFRSPREEHLVEVDVGRDHDAWDAWHPDMVGAWAQACGSTRVFEKATRGLTAYARHPKGKMGMTLGLHPVRASYEETDRRSGGPILRLSTFTAWRTAYDQKETGAWLATRLERASSMIDRIARSATPLS